MSHVTRHTLCVYLIARASFITCDVRRGTCDDLVMYRTCAFCSGKLDGDGGPSGLGVGRRLAFDEWKGRLWVICPKCARWNLAPLDDRLEQIEALARAAREGRVAAATEAGGVAPCSAL